MQKYTYFILFVTTFLFATEVEIYLECDNKPFSYCEDNKVKGVSTDIIHTIFARIKDYTVVMKPIQSNETIQKMKNKEIMMLGNILKNDNKMTPFVAEYTESYIEKRVNMFCNGVDHENLKVWPNDFHNLKITLPDNYILPNQQEDKKIFKENNLTIVYGDIKTNIANLLDKKVDCYIDSQIIIRGELMELASKNSADVRLLEKIQNIEKVYLQDEKPLDAVYYHIGFSSMTFPLRQDLITKINLAINVMRNTDEVGEIVDKYLDIYANPDRKTEVSAAIFNIGNFVSSKNDVNGVMSSVISAAFNNSDITVNYHLTDSTTAFLLTKWEKTCITFPWFTNLERENYMYISDPISSSTISLFYNNTIFHDGIKYDTIDDLRTYKIGIEEKASYKNLLDENNVYYKEFTHIEKAISELLLGEIDIFLANKAVFLYSVKELYPEKIAVFSTIKDDFLRKNYHVLFSKKCSNSKEILKKFNKGLKEITDNGKVDEILQRFNVSKEIYYGYDTLVVDENISNSKKGNIDVK